MQTTDERYSARLEQEGDKLRDALRRSTEKTDSLSLRVIRLQVALSEIDRMPYSMVNDSDSLRHTIKTMQSIARNILNSEAK